MSVLEKDIAAFERLKSELAAREAGKWALFHDGSFIGAFDDFDSAAAEAVERFDAGPYLIRRIGGPDHIQLSGGLIFTPAHALHSGRL